MPGPSAPRPRPPFLDPAAPATVVGAGMAGLTAAWELGRRGIPVVVHEHAPDVGGVVARHRLGGVGLDAGAESFATRNTVVADLCADLGLADRIVQPAPRAAWVHSASGAHPLLPGVFGIPADLDDPALARRLGAEGHARALQDLRLPPDVGTAPGSSLGALVEARMGPAVLDLLVRPVVAGVHAADPHSLDADVVVPGITAAVRRHGSLSGAVRALRRAAPAGTQVASLSGGMFQLPRALRAAIESQGGTFLHGRVESVAGLPNVVVATGMGEAARLLRPWIPVGEVPQAADIALVTLVLDCPELDPAPRGTGVLVRDDQDGDDGTRRDVLAKALTHATAKWDWVRRALPDAHVVRLSYGRPGEPTPRDDELLGRARQDAATLLGVGLAPDSVLDADVVRWDQGIPLSSPGHAARMEAVAAELEAHPGLEAAGAWIHGTGLAAVVAGSRKTARHLAGRLQD